MINRMMCIAILISFSQSCAATDVSADILSEVMLGADILSKTILGVIVDMLSEAMVENLSDKDMLVLSTPVTLEFVVTVSYTADVMAGVLDIIIIDVDMLADENVNGLSAVMTSLENALSAPWE